MYDNKEHDNDDVMEYNDLLEVINESINTDMPIYQNSRSQELRGDIIEVLYLLNIQTHSYLLDIDNYIKDHIKDAASLKSRLIERVMTNIGDDDA